MNGSNRHPLLVLVVLLAAGAVAAGCGKKERAGAAASPGYTVRAKIESIDGRELALHHEAIPDFVDPFGDKATMESMTMSFAAGPEVSLDGLAAGDVVEVRFHTDWNASPPLRLDGVKKLPPDTKLQL